MKDLICKVDDFYFIKTESGSGSRHWDIMVPYPFKSLEEARAYLKFHNEIYRNGLDYNGNFETFNP